MLNKIDFDKAATTSVDPLVLEGMLPYFNTQYGNASSIHAIGRDARRAVDAARRQAAEAIGATPSEIYFTSGGTESDNWALKGAAFANRAKGNHIISTPIEHHAVLHSLEWLAKQGFDITYLPVDESGRVNPEDVANAITPKTILVSVIAANNEIGTLEPIEAIGAITRKRGILFHTDAVQAVGAIDVNTERWHADLLSMSAHKLHGPKGIGALYIKKGTAIEAFMHGGAQERGKRASTENTPGIVGFGIAIEKAVSEREAHTGRIISMRDRLIDGILTSIPDTRLNGHRTERLPGNVNISIRYVEGEALLLRLDMTGIAASSGSACTSGSLDPSHVLLAIGLDHETAHGSLRFSINRDNSPEEVEQVLSVLPGIVNNLRDMSPLYHHIQ